MPDQRPNIQDAQHKAQAFLKSLLSDYIPPEKLTHYFRAGGNCDITVELTPDSFFKDDFTFQPTGLDPATVTMADTLHIVARHGFDDPFILKSTRNAAIKKHPGQYADIFDISDQTHGENLGISSPFMAYIALIGSLQSLADKGERPDPDFLRAGINVLRRMIERCKYAHVDTIPENLTGADMEDRYYADRAGLAVTMLSVADEKQYPKPAYMPDELYARIRRLNDIRDTRLQEDTKLELIAETEALLRDKEPMQAPAYRKEFDKSGEVSSLFAFQADMMRPILNHALDIAKMLGIDTRSRSRGDD